MPVGAHACARAQWTAVKRVLLLCKATHAVLAHDRTWRVLCHRFAGPGPTPTAPIYIPPVPLDGAWRATFVHICVNRCDGDALPPAPADPTGNAGRAATAAAAVPNRHKITVTARVRPKQSVHCSCSPRPPCTARPFTDPDFIEPGRNAYRRQPVRCDHGPCVSPPASTSGR